jgi:O-antigen/teichoic acid export membrane protein
MKIPFRGLFQNILRLGSGELLSRLCGIATAVLLGHRYGVVILGVYALAQGLNQYVQPLIDFGLRQVGARLLALYPHAASEIVGRVQRRRLGTAVLVLPLIAIYAAFAELPREMKIFLFAFSAVGALYAISLDWVAWGQERLYLLGLARSVVPLSILVFLMIGRSPGQRVLWWAVAGNAFGYLLQGAIFRRHPTFRSLGNVKQLSQSP